MKKDEIINDVSDVTETVGDALSNSDDKKLQKIGFWAKLAGSIVSIFRRK